MGDKGTLEGRLKQIRKELSLIDKDLKSLSGSASHASSGAPKPRIRSRELREKVERNTASPLREARAEVSPVKSKKTGFAPSANAKLDNDGRFLDYLSSSFNSGRPLGQERRIQRNKAILMLIIVLFILFLVLYRMML